MPIQIYDPLPDAAAPGKIDVLEWLRYAELIDAVLKAWRNLTVSVGGTVKLSTVRINWRGQEYTWDLGLITRTR